MSAFVGSSKNLKDLKEPLQLHTSHVPCGCGSSAPRFIQRSFSGSKCWAGSYSVKDRGEAGFWSGRELSAAFHQSDSHALILCAVRCVAASSSASLQLRSYKAVSGSPLFPSLPARALETSTPLTPGRTGTVGLALLGAYWSRSLSMSSHVGDWHVASSDEAHPSSPTQHPTPCILHSQTSNHRHQTLNPKLCTRNHEHKAPNPKPLLSTLNLRPKTPPPTPHTFNTNSLIPNPLP